MRSLRESAVFLLPTELKPWHGGEPSRRSNRPGVMLAASITCVEILGMERSKSRMGTVGKLRANTSLAWALESIARSSLKPDCEYPRELPHIPENREMKEGPSELKAAPGTRMF